MALPWEVRLAGIALTLLGDHPSVQSEAWQREGWGGTLTGGCIRDTRHQNNRTSCRKIEDEWTSHTVTLGYVCDGSLFFLNPSTF